MFKASHLILFTAFLLVLFASSCKYNFEGEMINNGAPETFTIIDTIIRFGDNRLESEVELSWWGDDADGFVTGYEFTFDQIVSESTVWIYTHAQDSTFILAPPVGEDSADFVFHIRSIDNQGLTDPSPASLIIPVKNSPPTILIIPGLNNPVKSFPVLKYYWQGSDPDGEANLQYYELFFNDTTSTPYHLDKTVTSAIFEAEDATADEFNCRVYQNSSEISNTEMISGLIANAWNKLFVRAVDQSNAKSNFATADSVYVKKVSSTILLVDGYSSTTNENFYATHLINNGFSVFDTIQIFDTESGDYTQQSADNLTQEKVFDLFDVIIWFSNDAGNSFSLAQKTTESFFNSGGKMLMSVYISSTFDPLSNFLDFTPISSLVDPVDTTLILDLGAQLNPAGGSYPVLESTSIISIVKPINLQIGATPVYNANLTAKDEVTLSLTPWTGNSTVMAKKYDLSGNTNFVISTLELHKLDGLMNMDNLFHSILSDEFGF